MRSLYASWEAVAPVTDAQRSGLFDPLAVSGRVQGRCPVLSLGRQCMPSQPAALGHGDLTAEDSSREAPVLCGEDGPKVQDDTPYGPRVCFQTTVERGEGKKPLVARFGGIPLRRQKKMALIDRSPNLFTTSGNELINRLIAGLCELCGSVERLEVHHIRKLADLAKPGRNEKPAWVRIMAKRRRKTLNSLRHLP
jgi:hypothetical protein